MLDLLGERRERLLVVRDPGNLAETLRRRYPHYDVTVTPTYLAGIGALSDGPARGLLVGVDPLTHRLDQAVAGLRKAAGESSRLVLCCLPSGEPAARRALSAGADDYLICPPAGSELDQALAMPPAVTARVPQEALVPTPTWEEITALAGVLAGLGSGRQAVLNQVGAMIAESLRTADVRIVAGDSAGCTGNPAAEPAIVEPIVLSDGRHGQILVGPRQRRPFSVAEVERVRHFGRLLVHLLDAADRQEHWQELALMDEASGLPNRRCLLQALDKLLKRAARERFSVTVLIFDLDGFKHFNDVYGHAAGDQVIRETGQLFRRCCRRHDIVARYAGDEFVVVFWDAGQPRVTGSKHPTDVLVVLRRFKQALSRHSFGRLGPEAVGRITISGGLASFPWDGATFQELLEHADQALLEAKRAGRDRIFLFGEEGRPVDELSADDAPGAEGAAG